MELLLQLVVAIVASLLIQVEIVLKLALKPNIMTIHLEVVFHVLKMLQLAMLMAF